jgi:hypothetical protein
MNYNKYLDDRLKEQIKEQIEENEDNVFALVLINEKSANFENVFDDLEMNHNFFTTQWGDEDEYSIRFLSGQNLDASSDNLRKILKDVYIDSCEIPLSAIV